MRVSNRGRESFLWSLGIFTFPGIFRHGSDGVTGLGENRSEIFLAWVYKGTPHPGPVQGGAGPAPPNSHARSPARTEEKAFAKANRIRETPRFESAQVRAANQTSASRAATRPVHLIWVRFEVVGSRPQPKLRSRTEFP